MTLMEACWKVEQCILCSSLTVNISTCLPDFRSFLYRLVCFANALNIHCTTAYNSTCSLLNIIPSTNFALLPPTWQLINCILYSSLLRRHSVSEITVMREQKGIIRSKGWTVCRMCWDFPVPILLQSLDVMTVMRCHIIRRKMMTPFCNRCDLLNGEQATHHHATQQHNMCH